jgi:hypothetical protein
VEKYKIISLLRLIQTTTVQPVARCHIVSFGKIAYTL